MFVDPKVIYDINGNSSFQLLFQRQSVDPSENFRELKKTALHLSVVFWMLMDQVIKKERGSSLPATSREHFS